MVLAAGLGKRMRAVNDSLPKPMVEVFGRSLIDRVLDQLVKAGIPKAVVNTSYKAELLEAHLAGRQDLYIVTSREEEPLETGGGIAKALPLLGDSPFFVLNSDVICLDGTRSLLHRLAEAWNDAALDALLLLQPAVTAYGYHGSGDFFLDTEGRIRRRLEHEVAPFVFTGIQIIHPRFFKDCPEGKFSLNVLWNQRLGEDGWLKRIGGIAHDGVWLHVGDPQGYKAAEHFLAL